MEFAFPLFLTLPFPVGGFTTTSSGVTPDDVTSFIGSSFCIVDIGDVGVLLLSGVPVFSNLTRRNVSVDMLCW